MDYFDFPEDDDGVFVPQRKISLIKPEKLHNREEGFYE